MPLASLLEILPERAIENIQKLQLPEFNTLETAILKRLKQGGDLCCVTENATQLNWPIVISAMYRSPESFEGSPRVIIITPTIDRALELKKAFDTALLRTEITLEVATDKGNMIEQRLAIYDGADIVLGNPKRIFDLYIQNGLNFGKVRLLILDQADEMIKFNPQFMRIGDSLPKCQRMIFTKSITDKVEKTMNMLLINPLEIEDETTSN